MMLYLTKKEVPVIKNALESRMIDLMRMISDVNIMIQEEDRISTTIQIHKEMEKVEELLERMKWYD